MMNINDLQIGFIGAGRLGKALAWHCARRGLRVAAAASQLSSERRTSPPAFRPAASPRRRRSRTAATWCS